MKNVGHRSEINIGNKQVTTQLLFGIYLS